MHKLTKKTLTFAEWAQSDFRDDTNSSSLARLDSTGHGSHTPSGSNSSTPGATAPITPSRGFATTQTVKHVARTCDPRKSKFNNNYAILNYIAHDEIVIEIGKKK